MWIFTTEPQPSDNSSTNPPSWKNGNGNGRRRIWWLPEVKEMLAFLVGVGMLFHQTVLAESAQTILVVSAVAIMGVLGSGVAQRALRKLIEGEDK